MKRIYHYVKGYRLIFFLAIIAIIVATIMQLAVPILIKYAIDSVIGNEPAGNMQILMDTFGKSLWGVVLIIIVMSLFRGIFMFLKGYLSAHAAESIAEKTKNKLYTQIQYLSFDRHTRIETGDMIQRCTSDVETMRRFLGVQVVDLGRIIFMIVFTVAIMLTMNVELTLYSVALIPILFLFSFIFFLKIQKIFKKSDEAEGTLTTVLQENLSGVRVVRAFGREQFEIGKFEEVNYNYKNITYKLIEILAIFWSLSDFMTLIQNGIVLIIGAQMVISGEITIGILAAFITYSTMLLWPVKQLGRLLSELGKTTVSIKRIDEILAEPIEEDLPTEITPEIKGHIEFKNVSFGYTENQNVLKGITFDIPEGSTLGILGSTGSGKSTLVHLLQRLYDYEGSIKIDGHELKGIKRSYIRSKIGLVLQEPHLYAKTVKENIGITNRGYKDEEIEEAAKIASIHHNILTFKDGYDTIIGEKGVSLSGGQKQRIAISRTIISKDKRVLIFDDSLSAVDMETDMRIRNELKKRSKDITTLIISHRITTLAESDQIIVLDEGRIVQQGTHEQLIRKEGLYKRIWNLQQLAI